MSCKYDALLFLVKCHAFKLLPEIYVFTLLDSIFLDNLWIVLVDLLFNEITYPVSTLQLYIGCKPMH